VRPVDWHPVTQETTGGLPTFSIFDPYGCPILGLRGWGFFWSVAFSEVQLQIRFNQPLTPFPTSFVIH
jgi:hypothetical protein